MTASKDVIDASRLWSVLLIDDAEISRAVVGDQLNAWGCRVTLAHCGAEGVALYEQGDIDIVICDVIMPDLSGLEVLTQIKEQDQDATVIMLTGQTDFEDVTEALRLGAFDYVAKDHWLAALHAALLRAVHRLRLIQENRRLAEAIAQQAAATLQLSAPTIRIWDRVLLLPIRGSSWGAHAQQMVDYLLEAVADERAQFVIVDLTGVASPEASMVPPLLAMVRAVNLLGASCIITGVGTQLAQTFVRKGHTPRGLHIAGSLQTGLHVALREIGVKLDQ